MRSYEAARSSFNFMEGLSWLIIICGGIAAALGLVASSSSGGALMVAAVLPGMGLAAIGSFGLTYAQTSRASVDSAEYAQQALQVSRDQLEISRQLLKLAQPTSTKATYTAPADSNGLSDISFDTESTTSAEPAGAISAAERAVSYPPRIEEYKQVQITKTPDGYKIDTDVFATLEAAKQAIDKPEARAYLAINSDAT